jgi:hypothetical protein
MKSLFESSHDTFFVGKAKMNNIILKTTTIDEAKVGLNRTQKLFGSFGVTFVIFHDVHSLLGQFIRNFQNELLKHFSKVIQNLETKDFVSDCDQPLTPSSFALIANPHTTIAAMRVIDSYDKKSWDSCLAQSYLHVKLNEYQPQNEEIELIEQSKMMLLENMNLEKVLNFLTPVLLRKILKIESEYIDIRRFIMEQCHASLLTDDIEQAIITYIQNNPIVELEMESISLNANGSLGIKWKTNEQIIGLRKSLSYIGGVAKHGYNVITTTIGYFPYCSESYRHEITQVLQEVIRKMESSNSLPTQIFLNVSELQFVQFSRNDLQQNFINKILFVNNQHISTEAQDQEFPVSLVSCRQS